ncbi:GNAT family N-acetyltransferase [Musicola paradisiaca]|uniref:GCN5-related N-acetyltransferase n=1 Tax=Musicola paradisiaca (strain Ech703) TaxID=579405 RepID=C6CC16_MUSP7|nr:GNAT family N-acetyltransferase [Musicola paradisiaca]ACS86776.1 GCN5-related N-acetyltransferase [Musicola paradisiaca Ech703]
MKHQTITIRKARRDDAPAAFDIRNRAIRHGCRNDYSAEQLQRWTDGPLSEGFANTVTHHFYVAEITGVVVATGMINLYTGMIDALFVKPEVMGKGVGKQVLHHLETLAHTAGLREVRLDASLNAAPFYRAQGFSGEKTSLYHSPRGFSLPCIPMIKSIG